MQRSHSLLKAPHQCQCQVRWGGGWFPGCRHTSQGVGICQQQLRGCRPPYQLSPLIIPALKFTHRLVWPVYLYLDIPWKPWYALKNINISWYSLIHIDIPRYTLKQLYIPWKILIYLETHCQAGCESNCGDTSWTPAQNRIKYFKTMTAYICILQIPFSQW